MHKAKGDEGDGNRRRESGISMCIEIRGDITKMVLCKKRKANCLAESGDSVIYKY